MKFEAHLIGSSLIAAAAVGITIAVNSETEPKTLAIIAVCIILGGLWPDIDTASIPSRWYSVLMCLSLPVFWHYDMPWHWIAVLIPYVAAKSFKHRSWTHSKWLVASLVFSSGIVGLVSYWIPDDFLWVKEFIENFETQIIFFAFGIASHKLFDSKLFKGIGR